MRGLGGGAVGSYQLTPRCYRCDITGRPIEDVSDLVLDGTVRLTTRDLIPGSFRATLRVDAIERLVEYRDWLKPVHTVRWYDPDAHEHVQITEPVGLFQVVPSPSSWDAVDGRVALEARDATWLLASDCWADGRNVPVGRDLDDEVDDTLASVGIPKHAIPRVLGTATRSFTFKPDTPKIATLNRLLRYRRHRPAWGGRDGLLTSRKRQQARQQGAARAISSAAGHVVDTVDLEPDLSRFANRVVVIGGDSSRGLITAVAVNRSPSSPTSTVNLRATITRRITDGDIETQDQADDLADAALEEATSVHVRLQVDTIPDPRFGGWDVVDLAIVQDTGRVVATGLWRMEEVELGFTPQHGPMRWTLNRVVDYEDVT